MKEIRLTEIETTADIQEAAVEHIEHQNLRSNIATADAPVVGRRRIIFLDLMRALAVIMMVQGHTVDVFLSDEFRDPTQIPYLIWLFLRGITAPIFLFTAGTVFVYLFISASSSFRNNPRVIKGLKRFLLLITLGYLLRFPSMNPFNYSKVSEESWKTFFAVDVLQLIGFGVLFLLLLAYIAEKFRLKHQVVFALAGAGFFILYPLFETVIWVQYFPAPIAGYFYAGTGSNFPLFPWVGYVLFGGVLGSFLAAGSFARNQRRFTVMLGVTGISIIFLSFPVSSSGSLFNEVYGPFVKALGLAILRLGIVLLINTLLAIITTRIDSVHRLVILVGRNTLLIYVVHLVILYGSAWNNGFALYYGKSLNLWQTITAALLMITVMVLLAVLTQRYSKYLKALFNPKRRAIDDGA